MDAAYLAALVAASADKRAERDEALLEYLMAYEEYTTCHVELEAQLKQGHMALSRARRDLTTRSGAGSPLGATLFPREFSALLVLANADELRENATAPPARRLRLVMRDADGPEPHLATGEASGSDAPDSVAPASVAAVESATIAELEPWGMGDTALQREIAAAVTDNGDDVGVACGDVIAIEHRDGTAGSAKTLSHSAYTARSAMSLSPSGDMGDLKRAQFAAMVASGDPDGKGEGNSARPKPQVKPSGARDPLKWFTLLPPPSLRQAQKGFRSAAESIVACANAQARMDVARARYKALLPPMPQLSTPAPSPVSDTSGTPDTEASAKTG